ncbi:DUF354 domain-containing protein [Methanococcoides sp. SA1]|nr:DUF354 domain-containing protein [Methanococcoides sp. SA1]
MKIILDIGHPKDINVFKNIIDILQNHGHEVKIVARAKENTKIILDKYNIQCEFGPYYTTMLGKVFGIFKNDIWLYKIAKNFNPDIFISPGSPYSAHVSRLLGKPHLAFIDTEIASLAIKLMLPFTDKVYTSSSFYDNLGPKQVKFNGYYELAYLHPKYFKPNKSVLDKYSLKENNYLILRLSALASHHDVLAKGFSFDNNKDLIEYIELLEKYGKVIIFSESNNIPLEKYKLNIDPSDFHDILYFSKFFIGEGATMASESAILGVPSIYVSNTKRGYLEELEHQYGLVFTLLTKEDAFRKAVELLKNPELNQLWISKRDEMIHQKMNVAEYIAEIIENYPKELK